MLDKFTYYYDSYDNSPPLNTPPPPNNSSSLPSTPPCITHPPPPSPIPSLQNNNYCEKNVVLNIEDFLVFLEININKATEGLIKHLYKELARIYHPDKNKPDISGLNYREATNFFHLLVNAYSF